MLTRLRALVLPIAAATTLFPRATREPAGIRGFTAESAKVQREWETKFRAIPEPARLRESMRRLAARPHHVGSAYGKINAEWLRDQLKDHGVDGLFSVKDRAAGLDEPAAMSPEDVAHEIATMRAERRPKNAS